MELPTLVMYSCSHEWGLCKYVIVHTALGGSPVILWISLGGKPKWLPLKFGLIPKLLEIEKEIVGEVALGCGRGINTT